MWYPNPYAIALMVISAAMLFGVVPIAWRRRRLPGGYAFLVLTTITWWWTLGYGLELGAPLLSTKLFLTDIEYIGIVTAPVAWFVFATQYTHHGKWLTAWRLLGLAAIPAITILLLWTNDHHSLMQLNMHLDTSGPFAAIGKTYGTWFWVHYVYCFLLMLGGSILLLHRLVRSTPLYRGQAVSLLLAVVPPWIANALHLTHFYPIHRLDLTPLAFGVSVFALAFALFRFRLLELIPLAQSVAVREIGQGMIVTDPQFKIVDMNPAAEKILGVRCASSIGGDLVSAIPPLASGPPATQPVEWTSSSETQQRSFEVHVWPLADRWQQQLGHAVTLHDISRRKSIEEALETTSARIVRLHETALQLAATRSEEGIVALVSKTCKDEFPYTSCAVFLAGKDELACASQSTDWPEANAVSLPLDSDRLPARVFRTGESACFDSPADIPSGSWTDSTWNSAICAPIREIGVLVLLAAEENAFTEADKHWVDLFLQHVEEATKRIRLQAALREQARRDALTGVYNRRHLPDAIQAEISRAKRAGHRLALVMLDINGFKTVNDRLGHQIGDRVLKEIGALLLRHVREYDLVIRYGGDEFLLILPESDGEIDAIVTRLRQAFSSWNERTDLIEQPLTVAMGIARWRPDGTEGWEETVRRADRAMYAEKTGHDHPELLF